MDKLQYDSFYKFLVSLGLILLALPFAALIFLFYVDPILISQVEYDALSEFSLQMIENRNELVSMAISVFPVVSAVAFFASPFCLLFGLIGWYKNQKRLDKKLDDETTIQTLNLLEMNKKEIDAKVEKEVTETVVETEDATSTETESVSKSVMAQYREIEDLSFKYFLSKYGRDYRFKRDIRMGKFDYDLIGVSKKDDIDLLVEIKYWKNTTVVCRRLIDAYRHLIDACENYRTIAHRDFSGIVFIVIPDDQLSRMQSVVERYLQKMPYGSNSKIVVKCIGESIIK